MKSKKDKSPVGGLSILRNEGLQALMSRSADSGEEGRRLRNLKKLSVSGGRLEIVPGLTPALNVSSAAPSTRHDDVHLQMLDRLAVEKSQRTVAMTYPKDGAWWLEVWSGDQAGYLPLSGKASLVDVLAEAASLAHAPVVHIEDSRGLPLNLVQGLGQRGLLTALSIFDFTFFCRRPQPICSTARPGCPSRSSRHCRRSTERRNGTSRCTSSSESARRRTSANLAIEWPVWDGFRR